MSAKTHFKVRSKQKHAQIEQAVIARWQHEHTFEESVASRPTKDPFVFYDGPPFLTGTPHHGHLLISAVKDTVARYQTMQGKRVERRWGWDCHGLPAEVFVEKQLGITSKKEIGSKISVEEYVNACRSAMIKTGTEWEDAVDRVGRWVEFKGAYKTMDPEYMESVWWAFKTLYDRGKIYDGEKILIYCTKDATPISKSEVAMENSYQQDTDPSLYVYFELEGSDERLLAWTTTPWTLPANVALAVNPKLEYALVEYDGRKVYVAKDTVQKVFVDQKKQPLNYKVVQTVAGSQLVGRTYRPLFENRGPAAHKVLAASFVTDQDGTGIVHQAPAYGEDDYELCKQHGVPVVSLVDENGNYTEGRWQERNIWEVNKEIAKTLVQEGHALKVEYITHDYPHCHRCGTKLMYRAHPSWFMDIQGQKPEMRSASAATNWVPAVLRDGRFANIIDSAPDWNLSRDRYWATPIPVWEGIRPDGTKITKVIGSYQEFYELTGQKLDDYHLPKVMNVTFKVDGVELHHIGKVLDCWFESGSMPFAQFHYPFQNKAKFEASFPADFITEAIDQTRGWFYSLTAVNVALFGQSPFKNLICTGFINAADGRKMSKKLKNYTDPLELMNKVSADAFRLTLLTSPVVVGEDINLNDRDVINTERKLTMFYNVLDFFLLYASVDGWQPGSEPLKPKHPLDQWILSKLQSLTEAVSENMNSYDLMRASRPLFNFLDDLSNWYVRRSRKRFWKSENDTDKNQAYASLYTVLTELSKLLAPFAPFMAEDIYAALGHSGSVHLTDWPQVQTSLQTAKVEQEMDAVRSYIAKGLALRAQAGLKVRQPIAIVAMPKFNAQYQDIVLEELNVKQIKLAKEVEIDATLTPALRREGLMREVIRLVQNARKEAGLQVDDRIKLSLVTTNQQLAEAIMEHRSTIMAETLATELSDSAAQQPQTFKLDGAQLDISLHKA